MPGPIIQREEWGAVHPDGFGSAPIPATEIWLHHSVTTSPPVNSTFAQDASAVRVLENIGQNRFGGGISYTFVVPKSGRIFEGHSINRRGAHTGGHNTVGRAICLIGDYTSVDPTPQQIESVRWLLWEVHRTGGWNRTTFTGGHRDVKATACPGDRAYAAIPQFNVPWAPPPPSTELGDPMQQIEPIFYNPTTWTPDSAGLNWRAVVPAECGPGSAAIEDAWVRWSAHWGNSTFVVQAYDGAGALIGQADTVNFDWWQLPDTVRKVVVEGVREFPYTQVGLSLIVKPKT